MFELVCVQGPTPCSSHSSFFITVFALCRALGKKACLLFCNLLVLFIVLLLLIALVLCVTLALSMVLVRAILYPPIEGVPLFPRAVDCARCQCVHLAPSLAPSVCILLMDNISVGLPSHQPSLAVKFSMSAL